MTTSPRTLLSSLKPADVTAAMHAAPHFYAAAPRLDKDAYGYFEVMRQAGAFDLTTARVIEPHCDAMNILDGAGLVPEEFGANPKDTWGVYASRAPDLQARPSDDGSRTWLLSGVKPWCSLADRLPWALITSGTPQGQQLFAVDLRQRSIEGCEEPWIARGLAHITSTSLRFDEATAWPVGDPGFYVGREGFAWGGVAVAAIWAGGISSLRSEVCQALANQPGGRAPDQIAYADAGRLDVLEHTVTALLRDTAVAVDERTAVGGDGLRLSTRVRVTIGMLAEDALETAVRALGPGPLATNERFARLVADLGLYVRQQHGQRDMARLGEACIPTAVAETVSS